MSRRSAITRNPAAPAAAQPVADTGDQWLLCDEIPPGSLGDGDTLYGSVAFVAEQSYRRVFLSATVYGLRTEGP